VVSKGIRPDRIFREVLAVKRKVIAVHFETSQKFGVKEKRRNPKKKLKRST
jgi:hypothetical protein